MTLELEGGGHYLSEFKISQLSFNPLVMVTGLSGVQFGL